MRLKKPDFSLQKMSILLPAAMMLGCSTAYVAPAEDAPTSSISFEVDADPILGYVASFFFFEVGDDRSCGVTLQRMAKINKGNPLAGKSTNTNDITIPAGRTIIIRSLLMPAAAFNQWPCSADSFLDAEADKKYTLRVKWIANQCDFDFFDTTSGEEVPVRVKNEPSGCR